MTLPSNHGSGFALGAATAVSSAVACSLVYDVGSLRVPADASADGAGDGGVEGGDPCSIRTGLRGDAPWAMFHGCPTHVGRSTLNGPSATPTRAWRFDLPKDAYGGPIIGTGGVVYVGIEDPIEAGTFYAVQPDGSARWEAYPAGNVSPPAAIGSDGTIYVGAGRGLTALRPDGSLKWRFNETNTEVDTAPTIGPDATIYFTAYDRAVYAIRADGTKKWRYDTGSSATTDWESSPALAPDGTVYAGTPDGRVHALRPDGTPACPPHPAGHLETSPRRRLPVSSDLPMRTSRANARIGGGVGL